MGQNPKATSRSFVMNKEFKPSKQIVKANCCLREKMVAERQYSEKTGIQVDSKLLQQIVVICSYNP